MINLEVMLISSEHTVCQQKKIPTVWITGVANLEQLLQNSSTIKKKKRSCEDLKCSGTQVYIGDDFSK